MLLTVLSFLAVALLVVGPSTSAKVQKAGVATGASRNAAIVETTAAILKETSDLRELSILRT